MPVAYNTFFCSRRDFISKSVLSMGICGPSLDLQAQILGHILILLILTRPRFCIYGWAAGLVWLG